MKNIINLVGDLEALGFNYDIYQQCASNVINKKYVNNVWREILGQLPLTPELISKLHNGEEFKIKTKHNSCFYILEYKISTSPLYVNKTGRYCLSGKIISDIQQEIAFSAELHNMTLTDMLTGQPSPIKHGCYYKYSKYGLVFAYYDGGGEEIYSTTFNFDFHTYDFKLNNSQFVYCFNKDKLISFANKDKDIIIKFLKFKNSKKYKVSEIHRGGTVVTFFYKGNIKSITKTTNNKDNVTVYYSGGNIKCTYSYDKGGLLDGVYIQYATNGDVIQRIPYKGGSYHGIYEKYKNGVVVEKTQYKHGIKEGLYYRLDEGKEIIRTYVKGRLIKRSKKM